MRDNKRRQDPRPIDATLPCRPARRIAMRVHAHEEQRLRSGWR